MSNYKIKREYKNAKDIDENFFTVQDDFSYEENLNYQHEGKFLGKYVSDKKLNYFYVFIVLALAVLFIRTFQLQVVRGDYYTSLAEINRTREKPILSTRGLIYDKNNRPIIRNIPIFDAFVLPKDLALNADKRAEQIRTLAQTVRQEETVINTVLAKYPKNFKYYLTIRENIDYQEAILLKIKSEQISGLYIETRNQREYLYPESFAHILGYIGKITEDDLSEQNKQEYLLNDYIGKTGLELSYEQVLRGKYGKNVVEVDVVGHEKKVIYNESASNGKNLILSIDLDVQNKAREILINALKKYHKKRAALVMLNPQNGEVLALVSLPDFNNNLFATGISVNDYKNLIENEDKPLYDRVIKGEYPSGSTIKPVVAAGALQEGLITDRTTVMSTGGLWLYDRWFFPDWSASGHGLTNVYRAIAWSVNTFFYMIGGGYEDFKGLGIEGLEKYYKIFGLGAKTGIDLPNESTGLVPDPDWKKKVKNEDWFIGDTYHIAIGQGDLLATPLQIANFTAAFANGGFLYWPHLVKEYSSNDQPNESVKPKVIRENFIDQEYLDIVKRAMRQTVTIGSAQLLNNLSVAVAGKTGTAQWHTAKDNHAWFTGFAPYDNPQVVITVLVEEGGEGSAVSVPIAYEILDWYFNVYLSQNNNS